MAKLSDEKQKNLPNCIFIIEISQHTELTTHRIRLEIQNSMLGKKITGKHSKPDDNVFKEKATRECEAPLTEYKQVYKQQEKPLKNKERKMRQKSVSQTSAHPS